MSTTHLAGLKKCDLHRRTPYGMDNVSMTQFSVARHFGHCIFNGDHYTYFPDTDELVRDDVLKWKRRQKPKNRPSISQTQGVPDRMPKFKLSVRPKTKPLTLKKESVADKNSACSYYWENPFYLSDE